VVEFGEETIESLPRLKDHRLLRLVIDFVVNQAEILSAEVGKFLEERMAISEKQLQSPLVPFVQGGDAAVPHLLGHPLILRGTAGIGQVPPVLLQLIPDLVGGQTN